MLPSYNEISFCLICIYYYFFSLVCEIWSKPNKVQIKKKKNFKKKKKFIKIN